jgi:hypothetical protein
LKNIKTNPSNTLRDRIKNLNFEIKQHFHSCKSKAIRRKILPGNSKSLWDAVKIAKDINITSLPDEMFHSNIKIDQNLLPDTFADCFESKVRKIVNEQTISASVYNGRKKIDVIDCNFMRRFEITKAIKTLKAKNCEGHDRIPQRILVDGFDALDQSLCHLFNQIYEQKTIPEQWLISKVIPIFKKGDPKNVENYRPISNLCSTSKLFEKLILLRIQEIELNSKIDLTGKSQHGFKKKHSTNTAGLTIQSLIARALDGDNYALMASLDLSSAFDVVNVKLLLKRLRVIGLPGDLIELISKWLESRYFYVTIDGKNSYIRYCDVGTVQGSVLGPILYALFVSPLFDLTEMTLFADDNYIVRWNQHLTALIEDMRESLEMITKWLKDSGLKVNETKTEICLFHKRDQPPIVITFNGTPITSKQAMNVLGISFDSKLNWQFQIQNAITKSKKALHAIYLIRKHFTKTELLQITTSNYYSILYYNAEIWLTPTLNNNSKRALMSASAAPLKLCTPASYDVL